MDTPEQVQRYGKCLIEREIGRGARSVVYLAWHEGLHIPVAVKVMRKENGEDEEHFSERFMREARIAAQLAHPNIVRVYDCGETEDSFYLVLEYIEGESCRDRMARGVGFDWHSATRIMRQVADGLNHASKKGIIHRDLKPENIMIDKEGQVRIADLGLAKEVGVVLASATAEGDVLGTPYYMSPEQVRQPGDVDFRSDIYSLGATFYHMATGQVPFEAPTPFEIMTMHLNSPLSPPQEHEPGLPEPLCEIIVRCMAKEPQNRYQSYGDLIRDMDALLSSVEPAGDRIEAPLQEALEETTFEIGEPQEAAAVAEEPPEERTPPPTRVRQAPPPDAAPEAAAPRPLTAREVPVGLRSALAKAAGTLAVLAYAFLGIGIYHVVPGVAPAMVVLAAFLALGIAAGYMALRGAAAGGEPLSEELSTALGWACERLDLPVPRIRATGRRDGRCQAYSFFTRKATLYVPGAWLAQVGLDGAELRAFVAHGLAGVYNGDADLRTILALPLGVLDGLARAVRALLWPVASLGLRARASVARIAAGLGLVAVCAAVALLFRFDWRAGLVGLVAAILLLAVSSFQRHSVEAADAFAVQALQDRSAVASMVAIAGLSGMERYQLLRDGVSSSVAERWADELPPPQGRGELVEAICARYSEAPYVPDLLGMAFGLFSTRPPTAERLNHLSDLPQGGGLTAGVLEFIGRLYAGLLGVSRGVPANLLDLGAVRAYAFKGLVAGLLATGGIVFLFLRGQGSYAAFLVVLIALGAALGLLAAYRACSYGLCAGRLGWALIVSAVTFCLTVTLGLCLAASAPMADLALHLPVAVVLVVAAAALSSVLYVRLGPKLGLRLRRGPADAAATAHTLVRHAERRRSLLEARSKKAARPPKGGPNEGEKAG